MIASLEGKTEGNIARNINGSNTITKTNEIFASKMLGIPENSSFGPDLIDTNRFAEVKFSLAKDETPAQPKWTLQAEQLSYSRRYKNREGFLVLGRYQIDRPYEEIDITLTPQELEEIVTHREVYITPWSWVKKFDVSNTKSGNYVYLKFDKLPQVDYTHEFEKGELNFTKGIPSFSFPQYEFEE